MRRLRSVGAIVAACAVGIAIYFSTQAHARSGRAMVTTPTDLPADAATAVASVLPGGAVTFGPGPVGGQLLTIFDGSLLPTPGTAFGVSAFGSGVLSSVDSAEVGWRADMVSAYIASEDPYITGFQTLLGQAQVDSSDTAWMAGQLRSAVGEQVGGGASSTLDQISPSAAVAQLQSSVGVLQRALDPAIDLRSRIDVVSIDAINNAFGLEVTLHVANLAALEPRLSDVALGLQTGLTGTANAVIEGLAINLVDDSGNQAGLWLDARNGSGGAVGGSLLDFSSTWKVDTAFPNLTGGPPTMQSSNETAAS